MSPRRRVKRQSPKRRDARSIVIATLTIAGVLAGTALAIWLVRPGGWADKQPRISVVLGVVALVWAAVVFLARTQLEPMFDRWKFWGTVAIAAVVLGSIGAIARAAFDWQWATRLGITIAIIIVATALVLEAGLAIRRLVGNHTGLSVLLGAVVAGVVGIVLALVWPGGIVVKNPEIPLIPPANSTTLPASVPTTAPVPIPSGPGTSTP
jgi:hypothetical protein